MGLEHERLRKGLQLAGGGLSLLRVRSGCPWDVETVTRTHVTPGFNCHDSFEVERIKDTIFLYLHQCPLVPAAEELNLEHPGRGRRG